MDCSPGFGSSSASRGRPVRQLTLTTLIPNSRSPRHDIFEANRLPRICDTGRAEAKVSPWRRREPIRPGRRALLLSGPGGGCQGGRRAGVAARDQCPRQRHQPHWRIRVRATTNARSVEKGRGADRGLEGARRTDDGARDVGRSNPRESQRRRFPRLCTDAAHRRAPTLRHARRRRGGHVPDSLAPRRPAARRHRLRCRMSAAHIDSARHESEVGAVKSCG